MDHLLVVDRHEEWMDALRGVQLVTAQQYITDPSWALSRKGRVINLCRSYSYQSTGYYVSLLAEGRRHRPMPDAVTMQDLRYSSLTRIVSEELEQLIDKSLRRVEGPEFALSIYFGKSLAKRDQKLASKLFSAFPCPLLRAKFVKKYRKWMLRSLRSIPLSEVPGTHRESLVDYANEFFSRRQLPRRRKPPKHWLAILVDPQEEHAPSNEAAINKFIAAADRHDVCSDVIGKEDFWRLGEYDALFIRATTFVNHYTFRFARRAEAEGLAVIDDPLSIVRCTNKVYQAERLGAAKVPIPRTLILNRFNLQSALAQLPLPIILKIPDGAFSTGVVKVDSEQEFLDRAQAFLEDSELVVAQEFVPTDFDWRVGIFEGRPLFVSKYYMAEGHWQVVNHHAADGVSEGEDEAVPVENAPKKVIQLALRAARAIGDGLYGVDLKQVGDKLYIMEVNDNPNIEAGVEDRVLKDKLYDEIINGFIRRIQRNMPREAPRKEK